MLQAAAVQSPPCQLCLVHVAAQLTELMQVKVKPGKKKRALTRLRPVPKPSSLKNHTACIVLPLPTCACTVLHLLLQNVQIQLLSLSWAPFASTLTLFLSKPQIPTCDVGQHYFLHSVCSEYRALSTGRWVGTICNATSTADLQFWLKITGSTVLRLRYNSKGELTGVLPHDWKLPWLNECDTSSSAGCLRWAMSLSRVLFWCQIREGILSGLWLTINGTVTRTLLRHRTQTPKTYIPRCKGPYGLRAPASMDLMTSTPFWIRASVFLHRCLFCW